MASNAVLLLGSAAAALLAFAEAAADDYKNIDGTGCGAWAGDRMNACDPTWGTQSIERTTDGAGPCEFFYSDPHGNSGDAIASFDRITIVVPEGHSDPGTYSATLHRDGSVVWDHSPDCAFVKERSPQEQLCDALAGDYVNSCDEAGSGAQAHIRHRDGAGPCEFTYEDGYTPQSSASVSDDRLTVEVDQGEHAGTYYATVHHDGSLSWDHAAQCSFTKHSNFHVSGELMNQPQGEEYCRSKGMSLAAIYDESELADARQAIADAGTMKAITAASSDGDGWRWLHHAEKWQIDGFPYNTGRVEDQAAGMHSGVYSLHAAGDGFIWDADGSTEEHNVLCRSEGAPPPGNPNPRPCIHVSQSVLDSVRAAGYEPRTCEQTRRLRRLKGLNPGPPCPWQKDKKKNLFRNPFRSLRAEAPKKKNPFNTFRKEVPKGLPRAPKNPFKLFHI